jgi:hypothetical protein
VALDAIVGAAAAVAVVVAAEDAILYSRQAFYLILYVFDADGMPNTLRIYGGRKLSRGSDPMSKKRMIHATRKNCTTSEFTIFE